MMDKEAFAAFHCKNAHGMLYEEWQLVRAPAKEVAREQAE